MGGWGVSRQVALGGSLNHNRDPSGGSPDPTPLLLGGPRKHVRIRVPFFRVDDFVDLKRDP